MELPLIRGTGHCPRYRGSISSSFDELTIDNLVPPRAMEPSFGRRRRSFAPLIACSVPPFQVISALASKIGAGPSRALARKWVASRDQIT